MLEWGSEEYTDTADPRMRATAEERRRRWSRKPPLFK